MEFVQATAYGENVNNELYKYGASWNMQSLMYVCGANNTCQDRNCCGEICVLRVVTFIYKVTIPQLIHLFLKHSLIFFPNVTINF